MENEKSIFSNIELIGNNSAINILKKDDQIEVNSDYKSIYHLIKDLLEPLPISNKDEIEMLIKVAFELKTMMDTDAGEVSDGYHTFNELYTHRAVLFAVICNTYPTLAWKSKQHDDPEFPMYDGMFIVGIKTPDGHATYHYDIKYWDIFNVIELERAPKYDGHTPNDAIHRIGLLGGFDL